MTVAANAKLDLKEQIARLKFLVQTVQMEQYVKMAVPQLAQFLLTIAVATAQVISSDQIVKQKSA